MPAGVSLCRLLLHPAGARAHGGRAARADRRRAAAARTGARALAWVTLLALGATAASLVPFTHTHVEVAHGLLAVDRFALFFKIVFLVAAAITVLMSIRYLEIEGAARRASTTS